MYRHCLRILQLFFFTNDRVCSLNLIHSSEEQEKMSQKVGEQTLRRRGTSAETQKTPIQNVDFVEMRGWEGYSVLDNFLQPTVKAVEKFPG